MRIHKPHPVESFENLRSRIDRFFRSPAATKPDKRSLGFDFSFADQRRALVEHPSANIAGFLNFISDALPHGDVYLFGGILRDLALLGRRG